MNRRSFLGLLPLVPLAVTVPLSTQRGSSQRFMDEMWKRMEAEEGRISDLAILDRFSGETIGRVFIYGQNEVNKFYTAISNQWCRDGKLTSKNAYILTKFNHLGIRRHGCSMMRTYWTNVDDARFRAVFSSLS